MAPTRRGPRRVRHLLLGATLALAAAAGRPAGAGEPPALYRWIAAKHGLAATDLYRRALAASGRRSRFAAAAAPWPWTVRWCAEARCETVYLDRRETMVRALETGRAAGWTLYIGPLGLPWDGVDPPPRAATFPAVTLDRAARQLARTAASPPPAAASAAPPAGGARRWGPLVDRVAREEGIDPALVRAVVATESAYRPTAVSPKGAVGLMQLMPATAARFGLTPEERFDPERNVRAGIRYLRWLLARFDGDLELALAGYNAGEGAVLKYGRQIPPFEETQDYVRRVTRHHARYAAAEGAGTL